MDYRFIAAIGGIILIDLVLSGDNALVIGAAASRLPRAQRLIAIFWGGVGAIGLRIALAIGATELLEIPFLRFAGGIVLLFITVKLLFPEKDATSWTKQERFLPTVLTILAADATMSLDNILAIAALAAGHLLLIALGLLVSMTILLVASSVAARLIERFYYLLDLAGIVLAWTSANLILEDTYVQSWTHLTSTETLAAHFGVVALVLLFDLTPPARRRRRLAAQRIAAERQHKDDAPQAVEAGDAAHATEEATHPTPVER